jgi:cephalosporin hydroxylase
MGRTITTPPTDLVAYQEIITSVRPDWVIDTSTSDDDARALYLASICELVGHGNVLSVRPETAAQLPQHSRLRYCFGAATAKETVDAVRETVGDDRAVVVLGSRADRATTVREFEAYAPLVPVGSYVVVAETIVNGHPVWPAFGPGPLEGVKQILGQFGGFVADPTLEKYSLTFNPGGYLKRVS